MPVDYERSYEMERALVKLSAFLTEQITSALKIVNERSYVLQSR